MENKICVHIQNLKGISDASIELPTNPGIYAITGINGSGKSTILNCMAKLVYTQALQSYFRNEGDATTKISFKYKGKTNTWYKRINWARSDTDEAISFRGHHEGSIMYGMRFSDAHKSKLQASSKINIEDTIEASDFVNQNMGAILKDNTDFYNGLRKTKDRETEKKYNLSTTQYMLFIGGVLIKQNRMSSGELLLATILDKLEKSISYTRKNQTEPQLIILDEIEIALHASAQKKLIDLISRTCIENNVCAFIATHSVHILSKIDPKNVFNINTSRGQSYVENPCYPAYASRSLDEPSGMDVAIFVEDKLAETIVDKSLNECGARKNRLISIIRSGGWENTLELQSQIERKKLIGAHCLTISILDGDIKSIYEKRVIKNPKIGSCKKIFLPIMSLEKYLRERLITDNDADIRRKIGYAFYQVKKIDTIIQDYRKSQGFESDHDGKRLLKRLCAEAELQNEMSEDRFISDLCSELSREINIPDLSMSIERALGIAKNQEINEHENIDAIA